jgi:NDP-sugar pyrophosphorylase family protein
MKALLLAGGEASRLNPFTSTRSKPMLPIANKTIIERNLTKLSEAGIDSVVIVHAASDTRIKSVSAVGKALNINVEFVTQQRPGIGGAVLAAKEKFNEGQFFLLGYADILSTQNMYSHLLSIFNRKRMPVASVCLTDEPTSEYGNVYFDDQLQISSIVEKPADRKTSNYVLNGLYVMPFELFGLLEQSDSDILGAFEKIISEVGLNAAMWEKDWIDINYPWSILDANKQVLDMMEESTIAANVMIPSNVTITGPVIIEEDVKICEGAVIHGPSIIGKGSFIGNNALVRSYCSIGPNTEIGFGTELKNCITFGNTIIGRISYLGDSVVGENCHVGSGTMTINSPVDEDKVKVLINKKLVETGLVKLGSFFGAGAHVGASNTIQAGTIIAANAVIPDNFTVSKGGD